MQLLYEDSDEDTFDDCEIDAFTEAIHQRVARALCERSLIESSEQIGAIIDEVLRRHQ